MESNKIVAFRASFNNEEVIFYAKPEHGAFYEIGSNGEIGSLHCPMNADGTPDIENIGEIEVAWGDC